MSLLYRAARSISRVVGPNSAIVSATRPLTEKMLRLVSGSHGLVWEINGIPCRIDPRYRAQLARNYDAHLATFLSSKVKPGHTCLDVGANIGAWVIQFSKLVGPGGKVYAFEPNPAAQAVLNEHIRLNDLAAIATVVPAAAGAVAGEVSFSAAGADGMSRIGEANPDLAAASTQITVPVVTLDAWCRDNGVVADWLFIDTEGFEGHVVAGATEMIRNRGAALGIVVEMHPSLWPSSGTNREEVAARFAAAGRKPAALTGQADLYVDYGHILLEPE